MASELTLLWTVGEDVKMFIENSNDTEKPGRKLTMGCEACFILSKLFLRSNGNKYRTGAQKNGQRRKSPAQR